MEQIDPEQYDAHAADFRVTANSAAYNAYYERPATLDLIGDVGGLDLLDVACGPGYHAGQLRGRGATVTGCDASPAMIDEARKMLGDDVDLRVHDASMPFDWLGDATLDLVLVALAYHYINDHDAFLAEMHRVLRPDGAIVISTHHPVDDWRRLGGSYFDRDVVTETWGNGWDMTTWRMPLTDLCAGFDRCGFVIDRLVEPRPMEQLVDVDPRVYNKLNAQPVFVLFRLTKRPVIT